ncbi:hypothetical protein JHK82_053231 [Glycine max]|nr:hypothetical protein JHK82_053231 [Glycine max]
MQILLIHKDREMATQQVMASFLNNISNCEHITFISGRSLRSRGKLMAKEGNGMRNLGQNCLNGCSIRIICGDIKGNQKIKKFENKECHHNLFELLKGMGGTLIPNKKVLLSKSVKGPAMVA